MFRRLAAIFVAVAVVVPVLAQDPPNEKNPVIVITELTHAAQAGDANAQRELAMKYFIGTELPQDYEAAAEWFKKAAQQGDVLSSAKLGDMYFNGYGVSVDYKAAMEWLQKAADKGNAQAQWDLGRAYFEGKGTKPSEDTAYSWFLKSAEQGYGPAMYGVGRAFSEGKGASRNPQTAFVWFEIGRRLGDKDSQLSASVFEATLPPGKVADAKRKADDWFRAHPDVKPQAQ